MKAASLVQVIKSKKQCFQLCLDRKYTRILSTRSGAQIKLRARKVGRLERNLSTPVITRNLLLTKAVVQRCSINKISPNSLEHTCEGVSYLIKLQVRSMVFEKIYFLKQLQIAASLLNKLIIWVFQSLFGRNTS